MPPATPSSARSWWSALRRWWQRPAAATTAPQAPVAGPGGTPAPPSLAPDARAYRQDAARHLYRCHAGRIFQGRLPEGLYAIGVLAVDLGPQGTVEGLDWLRAPTHAPEVVAAIEQLVHAAAPFPAPRRLGGVAYVDTWLWDASGQFQLDTLTEGQGG